MFNEEEMNQIWAQLKKHPEMLKTIKNLLDITDGVKGIEIACL